MPGHFTFYMPAENAVPETEQRVDFGESEFKHAIRTLRYNEGDIIEISNGRGYLCEAEITAIQKNAFSATIKTVHYSARSKKLRLVVGILHNTERMEWLVEKATELGVAELIFVTTERSEKRKVNTERLLKIAIGALKQSHGAWLPEIQVQNNFAHTIATLTEGEKYIAYCDAEQQVLPLNMAAECTFLIGPEGDFSEREISAALTLGFRPCLLGSNILRTETAAIAVAVKHYLS